MSPHIRKLSSPNFEPRKDNKTPRYIVLHYTGSEAERARDYMTRTTPGDNQSGRVSAHYMVLEDGAIEQFVDEDMRAWHAGNGYWQGETDMNSASIGIEIVNMGINANCPDYPPAQIAAIIALCQDIMARRPAIVPKNVIGHSDLAPLRKVDPGPAFPWETLADAGVGVMPDPLPHEIPACAGITDNDLDAALTRIGYDPSRPLITRIQAFAMHFDRQNLRTLTGLEKTPNSMKAKIINLASLVK